MRIKLKLVIPIIVLCSLVVLADTYNFGTGANQFSMDFVNIGHTGNVGETQDYGIYGGVRTFGSVGYHYQIGKFEVTIDQFMKVHNDYFRVGDGDENYWNTGGRNVGANAPATYTDWNDVAMYCNWLTTGDARNGAYILSEGGWSVIGVDRAAAVTTYGTVFVVPTEDEWYKAAYFKSDGSGYTTYAHGNAIPGEEIDANYGGLGGSYSTPWEVGSGTLENNGTFDMDGNVWEWFESPFDPTFDPDDSGIRGGSFDAGEVVLRSSFRLGDFPGEFETIGFRVAAIPEPSSVLLLTIGAGGLIFYRRAKRQEQENRRPSRRDFT